MVTLRLMAEKYTVKMGVDRTGLSPMAGIVTTPVITGSPMKQKVYLTKCNGLCSVNDGLQ
jgi:hypothetical protein